MEKDWIEYQCKSGQTLLLFNKVTGEHKWPHGLPQGIINNSSIPYKKYSTTSTQTDDNGCNNGCMSMYINPDQSHISNTSYTTPPRQQPDVPKDDSHLMYSKTIQRNTLEGEMMYNRNVDSKSDSGHDDNNENISDDDDIINEDDESACHNLMSISRSDLEQVVNVLEDAEHFHDEVDTTNRRDNLYEHVTNSNDYLSTTSQSNCSNKSQNCADPERFIEPTSDQEKEKNFECTYCKRRFTYKCNMNVHIRTHTGVKPFQCNYCTKMFADKSTLNKHIRKHTGERPFECSVCHKKFAYRESLRTHTKTHTGEKPYQCTICNTKFTQLGNLRVHFKVHTGEKAFECPICKKKFSRKSTLKVHVNSTSCLKSVEQHTVVQLT